MTGVLLLALLGCRQADPELVRQRRALDLWREGKQHLAEDEPAEAVEAFERALDARPRDPVLRAWLAHALARQGKLDQAIAVLDALLVEHPTFAEARYNRAAYLARQGELDAAAADLRKALEQGTLRSRDVLEDPDFAPHLDHPAFGFLPTQSLVVAVDAPDGPVFLGNRADVRLRVLGTEGAPVSVTAAEARGPVRLVKAVEDVILSSEGAGREIVFSFEALGPGQVHIGPLEVRAGARRAEASPVTFEAVAPEGRQPPESVPPLALTTPSEIGERYGLPSATWLDEGLLVKALPGDRVEVEPGPALPSQLFELREGGVPQWVLYRYELEARPERVKVLRGGKAVLDAAPSSG